MEKFVTLSTGVQAIPGARLIVCQDYGHAFHWEDPARFAADPAAFVAAEEHL